MKPIRGLAAPTPGLEEFVRAFPDERKWKAFRDHASSESYEELLKTLIALQHGLCCYCEIDLKESDQQVEHFHPKSHRDNDVNHTIDCTNLMAACCGGSCRKVWGSGNSKTDRRDSARHRNPTKENLSCGQFKKDQDPTTPGADIIDPRDPRSLPTSPSILRVTLDGRVEPDGTACQDAGWDPELVRGTIQRLGLNCERLRVARADRLQNLGKMYNPEDHNVLMAAARVELLPDEAGRLPAFFTTTRSFFREAAELVLAEHPQSWI